ncbi:conserved hypothetical protein [Ricinus communis]|uniref:Uncharacterized protein n=1 Tax=Ricinus communis TaxID=3988 RepID=B9RPX1_RICCO|nr:conserved hypothetical protein [Ricinus communis]
MDSSKSLHNETQRMVDDSKITDLDTRRRANLLPNNNNTHAPTYLAMMVNSRLLEDYVFAAALPLPKTLKEKEDRLGREQKRKSETRREQNTSSEQREENALGRVGPLDI